MKRKVLTILSNRFAPSQPPRFVEVVCETDGTILKEEPLKGKPRQAVYDEVWENDDGKQSLDSCTRMKRHYKHPLLKKTKGK